MGSLLRTVVSVFVTNFKFFNFVNRNQILKGRLSSTPQTKTVVCVCQHLIPLVFGTLSTSTLFGIAHVPTHECSTAFKNQCTAKHYTVHTKYYDYCCYCTIPDLQQAAGAEYHHRKHLFLSLSLSILSAADSMHKYPYEPQRHTERHLQQHRLRFTRRLGVLL